MGVGWRVVQKLTAGLVAHSLLLLHTNTDAKLSLSFLPSTMSACVLPFYLQ